MLTQEIGEAVDGALLRRGICHVVTVNPATQISRVPGDRAGSDCYVSVSEDRAAKGAVPRGTVAADNTPIDRQITRRKRSNCTAAERVVIDISVVPGCLASHLG